MTDKPPPWHTDWHSTADLSFPPEDDNFQRDVHLLTLRYTHSLISAGDRSLIHLLKFPGEKGKDHCELCDKRTGDGHLIICDQCEYTCHGMLGVLVLRPGGDGLCLPSMFEHAGRGHKGTPARTPFHPSSVGATLHPHTDVGSTHVTRVVPGSRPPSSGPDFIPHSGWLRG